MKQQQQGLDFPNSDSARPDKPFITDKYNNNTNLNKLKKIKYFTKELLKLRAWAFSEEAAEKLIV